MKYKIILVFDRTEAVTQSFFTWQAMWEWVHTHERRAHITGMAMTRSDD
jgi:hypothetical protein